MPLNLLLPAESLNFVIKHAELDLILTSEKLKDRLEGVDRSDANVIRLD